MYPRNAASPERIAIGAVVQISDGAVQTSGVSVSVLPQGGASAGGGGTISYENGIVCYLPTQAETNYTSFIVTAYKTGCIPVSVTIVTSASATAGYGGVDWSKVTSATSTVNLSGTTVKTLTDAPSDSSGTTTLLSRLTSGRASNLDNLDAAITTRLASAGYTAPLDAAGTRSAVGLASANLDTQLSGIQSDTNDIQTRIPAALVSGRMDASVGAMASNVLTAAATAADFGAEVADAVWDEVLSGHAGVGSAGAALSAAGSAGDPWSTPLPGAYGAGSAGYIVGTNLDQAVSAAGTLTAGERNSIADALLGRNVGGGSSSGRLVKEALYALRNKWTSAAGTYTVYEVDDVTVSWTSSLTGTAGADPITASDPA